MTSTSKTLTSKIRTLVLGDVHGAYKALLQVLERSKFNPKKDRLICLGDVADGWSQVIECVDYLKELDNLILIAGNHDEWAIDYLKTGATPHIWTSQGGFETLRALQGLSKERKMEVLKFFEKRLTYYEEGHGKSKRIFVHGGINPYKDASEQDKEEMLWDRVLIQKVKILNDRLGKVSANELKLGEIYDEIYIGHTSTWSWSKVPYIACGVYCLDQGAGWFGKLTIMDIDTKEYWQSDNVVGLYPDEFGRRG